MNKLIFLSDKFIYDGYLQIATLDAMNSNAVSRLIYWDPAEPVATRPLMVSLANSGTFFPTVDLTKNVCELIDVNLDIATTYDYTPFGSTSISGTHSTPFQFSSEFTDSELGLVYYNYRHYNPTDGRWMNRDTIEELGGMNLLGFVGNNIITQLDVRGFDYASPWSINFNKNKQIYPWHDIVNTAYEAFENYMSNRGGVAYAGQELLSRIRNGNDYKVVIKRFISVVEQKLSKVSCFDCSGTVDGFKNPWMGTGAYTYSNATGGISYDISVSDFNWKVLNCDNNCNRTISANFTTVFSFNDKYEFVFFTDNFEKMCKTFFTDIIPMLITDIGGGGTMYRIKGDIFERNFVSIVQKCKN